MLSNRILRTSCLAACFCSALLLVAPAGAQDGEGSCRHFIGCGKSGAAQHAYEHAELLSGERATYDEQVRTGLREALDATDVQHCELEIEVIPSQSDNLFGTCRMTIMSTADGLTQFTFRLRSQFSITSALVNDTTPVTVSSLSTTSRQVTLDRTYNTGEVFTLTIAYGGHAESRGFGSIEYTTHNAQTIVYTLSEAYFAYTWWPAKDGDFGEPGDNGDKFTLDLAVIAPNGMVSASNGVLEGIDALSGNRTRYRWSTDYKVSTYLVCFSTTNYDTWSVDYTPLRGGTMPVLFYIYPEYNTAQNRAAWEQTVQMITTLRDLYGEYPFVDEKYGIYQCQFGGGMEHQTFTAQGTFDEMVTVHELGHQWWGDMITCKTWNHIWLNEGFASYTEALWQEFKPGSSGQPALQAYMDFMAYTGSGSVYVSDAEVASLYDIFDSLTSYDKGAWVLHMLRHVLGDASFFDALAAYRAAYAGEAATTEDFQAICEPYYGDTLDWFFQEWVYGQYAPAYSYGWSTTNVGGQDYLLLYLDQTQSASIQRFTMPIDVVVDGVTHVVFNDHDPEYFVIPVDSTPTSVQLDPYHWVLWSNVSSTSYIAGPPTVVVTNPAPGAQLSAGSSTDTITVTFHTNVTTSAGDYALVGANTGSVPLSFAYDSGTKTVTLTATGDLPADNYTLTISDAVTAVNSGMQLDGEIAKGQLPSGEGAAGGDAVIEFAVGGLIGDMNCDGAVDLFDIDPFVLALTSATHAPPFDDYDAAYPNCDAMLADADGSGVVDNFDIDSFVGLLTR